MVGSNWTRLDISSKGTCQRSYRPYKVQCIHAETFDKHFKTTTAYYFLIRPIVQISELGAPMDIESWSNSDWAGCVTTRRSTSGLLFPFWALWLDTLREHTAHRRHELRRSRLICHRLLPLRVSSCKALLRRSRHFEHMPYSSTPIALPESLRQFDFVFPRTPGTLNFDFYLYNT